MMRTPKTILNFTQKTWMQTAKEFQTLQADVQQLCKQMGFEQFEPCSIILDHGVLNLRTTAAMAVRLRHIKSELFNALIQKGWAISDLIFSVQKNNEGLQQHLYEQLWVNPNELRYGKRDMPTIEQRKKMLEFIKNHAKSKPHKSVAISS
jgi:hypothetical protein